MTKKPFTDDIQGAEIGWHCGTDDRVDRDCRQADCQISHTLAVVRHALDVVISASSGKTNRLNLAGSRRSARNPEWRGSGNSMQTAVCSLKPLMIGGQGRNRTAGTRILRFSQGIAGLMNQYLATPARSNGGAGFAELVSERSGSCDFAAVWSARFGQIDWRRAPGRHSR